MNPLRVTSFTSESAIVKLLCVILGYGRWKEYRKRSKSESSRLFSRLPNAGFADNWKKGKLGGGLSGGFPRARFSSLL
jgi:hypothetical protein